MPAYYFTLSEGQRAKVKRGIKLGNKVTLTFAKGKFQKVIPGEARPEGMVIAIDLNGKLEKRANKAIKKNTGVMIEIGGESGPRTDTKGEGLLSSLASASGDPRAKLAAEAVGVAQDFLEDVGDDDRIRSIFRKRLQRLRGHGVGDAPDPLLEGLLVAIKMAQKDGLDLSGEGVVQDFFDGFIFGLNPKNWGDIAKLGVAELDNAIEEGKRKK